MSYDLLHQSSKMDKLKNGFYNAVPTKENKEATIYERPAGFGARHMQALLLFICICSGYTIRSHLSVTMVAMTTEPSFCDQSNVTEEIEKQNLTDFKNDVAIDRSDHNANDITNNSEVMDDVLCDYRHDESTWSVFQTYTWNKSKQEMMMFAFFLGYTTMMIPAGMLAQKYGGKKPILGALFINGVVSILTPWMPIVFGWLGVCVCRLLQGLSQAAMYPSIHTMLAMWAPLSERGRLSSYIYSGSQIGTILAFQISGFLSGSVLGWPSSFWMSGILCLLCFFMFLKFGAATPYDHPTISDEELMYITGRGADEAVPRRRKTPWKHILTSTAVLGIVMTHMGSAVGFLFVLTQTPRYLSNVLNVDIRRNGVYSSLPFMAMVFMTLLFGWLSDYCKIKGYLSIRNIRRIANTIGTAVSSLFLLWFAYVNSVAAAVVLLVIGQGLHSGTHVGFHINQIDLCPNFAGPVFALGNMMASLAGLMVPVIVSQVVGDDVGNHAKWQLVFWIMCSVMVATNMFFVIFARGELQPWNDIASDSDTKTEELKLRKKSMGQA